MTAFTRDPILHSHIEDVLPDNHPLAFKNVYCVGIDCRGGYPAMLHAENNECMQTWIEAGAGNFCISCFVKLPNVEALGGKYAMPHSNS